jgi:leucyl aminopeptidase (aminopeptidase T)
VSGHFAELLLDALGARPGERLAVVADRDRAADAVATAREAEARGLVVELVVTDEDYRREEEVPAAVAAAVDAADAALLFVAYPRIQFGGHSALRKRATARGARIGFVTRDVASADALALAGVAERTRRLAAALTEAERALVTSPGGTRVELDLRGRRGTALTNELSAPGAWGALPDFFEAAVAPVEGSARGTIVVDGTSLVTGIAHEPIWIDLRGGAVAALRRGNARELRAYLEAAGENATNLAELGIGTNALASRELTGTFVDKKIGGTVHFGLGDNRGLGGRTQAAVHTDVQVMDARVELDGRLVVDGRRLVLP